MAPSAWETRICTEADMPRVFEVVSLAFANDHEYVDSCFPNHTSPSGRKVGAERMLDLFRLDPNGHFVKVVDTSDNDKIVAAARWCIYKDGNVPPQPQMGGDYWENEEEKEFACAIFWAFFSPRQRLLEQLGGRLVALDMMMVDPAYQRKGAGRMLVQWGIKQADEWGIESCVEGSEKGRPLYESQGFKPVSDELYVCPVPEKFANRRKQVYWWMRRPVPTKA